VANERILAMPGVYAEGVTDAFGNATPNRPYCRVNLKSCVTLESIEGPEKTVILGAAATGADADACGRGEGGVACVRFANAAGTNSRRRLAGFTLTGGRSELVEGANLDRLSGAAVNALWSNTDPAYASIENCIITNNFGKAQVLSAGLRVYNSVIGGNAGGNAFKNFLQGCLVRDGSCANLYGMENCTVGTEAEFALEKYRCVNSLVMGTVKWHANDMTFTNCVFLSGRQAYRRVDCLATNADAIAVNADYVPTNRESVVVDRGALQAVEGRIMEIPDARGGQRVYNGAIDVGAIEYDWRRDYAEDLSKKGQLVVSNASSAVVESEAQTVLVPAGASVKGAWTVEKLPKHASVKVRIDGTGTFTVKVGGVAVATLAGPVATVTNVEFPAEAGKTVEFAYEGEDGCAEILKTGLSRGLMLLLR